MYLAGILRRHIRLEIMAYTSDCKEQLRPDGLPWARPFLEPTISWHSLMRRHLFLSIPPLCSPAVTIHFLLIGIGRRLVGYPLLYFARLD
jgi:hypothetical protein